MTCLKCFRNLASATKKSGLAATCSITTDTITRRFKLMTFFAGLQTTFEPSITPTETRSQVMCLIPRFGPLKALKPSLSWIWNIWRSGGVCTTPMLWWTSAGFAPRVGMRHRMTTLFRWKNSSACRVKMFFQKVKWDVKRAWPPQSKRTWLAGIRIRHQRHWPQLLENRVSLLHRQLCEHGFWKRRQWHILDKLVLRRGSILAATIEPR